MFLVSYKCRSFPNLIFRRMISHSLTLNSNYYMTLGLSPSATQDQIKKSYFELCKKYHPDKNKGSLESAEKFRTITEAYEVLGNEKLRREYDQKMYYNTGGMNNQQWKAYKYKNYEDYSYGTHRVYKRQNINRTFSGRTRFYDFDAWTSAHYPPPHSHFDEEEEHFERVSKRAWRKKKNENIFNERREDVKTYFLLMWAVTFFLMIFTLTPLHSTGVYVDLSKEKSESYQSVKRESNKDE